MFVRGSSQNLLAAGALALASVGPAGAQNSALLDYVYTPDPAFQYTLIDTLPGVGFTAYVLLMDSLSWRAPSEVDRTLWSHQVALIVPENVTTNTALLLVNGGSDPLDPIDQDVLDIGAPIAILTGSVLAVVSQIPNQPLLFADEAQGISEDALVAYSWDKAIDSGDATWAAYLPMTKASVRAMDAVQDFIDAQFDELSIDEYVVTGFSKRGATAWLVAAIDPRVRAVAPGVFDILDMPLQIERHYQAYGFYAPAIEDYVNYDIVTRTRSPEGRFLVGIVDPLSYVEALSMPKLILTATGDQFFLPDATSFYLDRLAGETLVRQMPNTDHGFTNAELQAFFDILAWYETVLADAPRPQLDWTHEADGSLLFSSDVEPLSVTLWRATNPDARDFRLETLGAVWTDTELTADENGNYRAEVAAPPAGYTGYMLEASFPGLNGVPQTYTTPVFVTPDTLPFELDDQILNPRRAPYWRCQIDGEPTCPGMPDYTAAQLEGLLPFTVFGDYLRDLGTVGSALKQTSDAGERALRGCAVTRLNIAAGEQGWYSSVDLGRLGSGFMWQLYEQAESAYSAGDALTTARICAGLNRWTSAPAESAAHGWLPAMTRSLSRGRER